MTVGILTVELWIPETGSLKGKRRVVKSVIQKLRNSYNVSAAEVDGQDTWQRAVLAIAFVSTSKSHAHSVLMDVVGSIERRRMDAEVVDYSIELM